MAKKSNAKSGRSRKAGGQPSQGVSRNRAPYDKSRRGANPSSVAVAYSHVRHTTKARVMRSSVDSCRIVHREYLGNLNGTTTYSVPIAFTVQPGIEGNFPWLSVQAQGWEKYEFKRLRYSYVPFCGSTTQGTVMLIPDYNSADSAPGSQSIALSYHGAVTDSPWKEISCLLDPVALKGMRFIRSSALLPNLDIKMYDAAQMFFGVNNAATNGGWGGLYVDYDVEFFNPQLPSSGPRTTTTGTGSTTIGSLWNGIKIYGPAAIGQYAANVLEISGLNTAASYTLIVFCRVGNGLSALTSAATQGLGNGFTTQLDSELDSGDNTVSSIVTFTPTAEYIQITHACTGTSISSPVAFIFSQLPDGTTF